MDSSYSYRSVCIYIYTHILLLSLFCCLFEFQLFNTLALRYNKFCPLTCLTKQLTVPVQPHSGCQFHTVVNVQLSEAPWVTCVAVKEISLTGTNLPPPPPLNCSAPTGVHAGQEERSQSRGSSSGLPAEAKQNIPNSSEDD